MLAIADFRFQILDCVAKIGKGVFSDDFYLIASNSAAIELCLRRSFQRSVRYSAINVVAV